MTKDKFAEMYPDYKLIPEKTSRTQKIALRVLAYIGLAAAIAVPIAILNSLGKVRLPVPNAAGLNKFSLNTARDMAIRQVEAGQFDEAIVNFKNYFAWGGQDAEAKRLYEEALTKSKVKALEK